MVAVVTGSSRGIGRAVAEWLAARGATVVRASRTEGCDVSREADVERLFGGLERLDVLVNNAAVLTPRKALVDVTSAEWDETMAVNVRGVFLCTRAALRIMLRQRSGWIINISSGAGKRAAPMWGPYAVSKWAVEGLTKCVAAEVEGFGIKVIAVNPGGTRTAMRASAYPQEDPMTLKPPEKVAEFIWEILSGRRRVESGDSVDYE
ncbi:MAG: SDR family oxidoreductase [Verrucomicrobiae bacterium]|nr:SDR family oxidoreductase [Verrucomicrobiae bacterium]